METETREQMENIGYKHNKNVCKEAFVKSIPILCSYLFVSMAYGIMMEEAGYHWYYSLLVSLSVYTGAFQFVFVTLLSSGASFLTVGISYKWRHNTLISIVAGTAVYMILIRIL